MAVCLCAEGKLFSLTARGSRVRFPGTDRVNVAYSGLCRAAMVRWVSPIGHGLCLRRGGECSVGRTSRAAFGENSLGLSWLFLIPLRGSPQYLFHVLSMSEELRRALYASSVGSLDLELLIPELVGVTEILTEEHRKKLCRHLPARAEGYLWTLVFSTSQHGFSLNSLYRKMNRLESPILMVIEDTEHNVFGALTSCAMKVSDHFYGTGESLLFRFTPEFQVGKFGLWLDGDLYQGTTQPCSTYGNEPLSPQEDFVVKTLECWAFI
uniref:Oxidation resistance protein 1 n=1 Tax=Timema tahoe TaxID=61484 RepID=A0A7R9NUG5_9NEOP|nr:unnamed protein product [Timema tahoe]